MSNRLVVSWDQYHALVEQLTLHIAESAWDFDMVMGLSRGGLRVADVISRVLNKPFATLAASSYRESGGTEQGDLVLSADIATTAKQLGPRVLVVDDLVDTGQTLAAVVPHLLNNHTCITQVKTAVLWVKGCATFNPDYCVESLPNSPWIVQPFEVYDTLNISDLSARVKSVA